MSGNGRINPRARVLRGEFTLEVGGQDPRAGLLPRQEEVGLGRGATCAIRVRRPWVPRDVGTFQPVPQGWVFQNGPSIRVWASSQWVKDGRFQPGALVMLQQGSWEFAWPLDEVFVLRLEIQRGLPTPGGGLEGRPPAH